VTVTAAAMRTGGRAPILVKNVRRERARATVFRTVFSQFASRLARRTIAMIPDGMPRNARRADKIVSELGIRFGSIPPPPALAVP
jgi:hypothetical protein